MNTEKLKNQVQELDEDQLDEVAGGATPDYNGKFEIGFNVNMRK